MLSRIVWDPKQWQFITDTNSEGEQLPGVHEVAIAGMNQGGKSTSLKAKCAHHATGRYPADWPGRRWDRPIVFAIGGETAQTTRDLLVDGIPESPGLLGMPGRRGSGFIPADCFDEKDITYLKRGISGQIDYFDVKHYGFDGKFDGYSRGYVFAYAAGWERVAGYPFQEVYIDEEPAFPVYDEFSARLNYTGGYLSISFTPLLGETQIYNLFDRAEIENQPIRRLITFGIDDAKHIGPDRRNALIAKYRNHPLASARLHGLPVRGAGLVFTVPNDVIVVEDFLIPDSWPQIIGVDFPHTTGRFTAVKIAQNPATDQLYLVSEIALRDLPTELYASRLRAMGGDRIPVAWPHDGGRRDLTGTTVAERYRQLGIRMLPDHAHVITPEGNMTHSLWEAVDLIVDRMHSGRFNVFRSCPLWLGEKGKYRHQNGKIPHDLEDDVLDASFKAVLMLRFAESPARMHGDSEGERFRALTRQFDFYTG